LYIYKYMCDCPPTGLIIDAFGELRDQLEQVKEDMEVRTLNYQLYKRYALWNLSYLLKKFKSLH